jgi:hypothetical protein
MKYIYKNTDKIPFGTLKKLADSFFIDQEPLLVDIKNRTELEYRLRWLSEGCMHYKCGKSPSPPHGGDTNERTLYSKWVEFLEFYGY